jgi:cell shape-determining protein MreD
MRYIIYIILIGAIIGITFGLFSTWGWNGLVPDLILLLVIALSLVFDTYDYLFVGLLGGIWLDVMYSLPIGSFTIPFVLCGAISSYFLRKWLFSEIKWYHFIVAIIAATVFVKVWVGFYGNLLFLFNWVNTSISWRQLMGNLIFGIIANVILAYPVYVIVEMFARSQLRWQRNRIRL